MSGALYPAPITHNGTVNATFNPSDFNNSSKLNATNVTGPLTVSGLATFNSGTQTNGTQNIAGTMVCTNSTVNINQTIGGTETVTGLINANGGILTNNTAVNAGTGTLTAGIATCSGLITANNGLTLTSSSGFTKITQYAAGSSNQTIYQTVLTDTFVDNQQAGTIHLRTNGGGSDLLQLNATTGVSTNNFPFTTGTGLMTCTGGLQQPLPSILTTSATPSVNCLNNTYLTYTLTLSANVTGFTFTNMRAGGQYIIFITGGGSVFTISNTLTGSPTIKTNYATAISVPISGKAVLTAYYDGTNIFINSSAYS